MADTVFTPKQVYCPTCAKFFKPKGEPLRRRGRPICNECVASLARTMERR
jgi:transposase-like protein